MDDSNFPIKDREALKSIVPRNKGIKILEVGSWTGGSTIALGEVAKECGGFVIAVDHWRGTPNTWMQCKAYHNDIFAEFQKNIKEAGLEKYIFPLIMDSRTASRLFTKDSFDFIFIDGDHDFEAVKGDIVWWMNKTKILCGHDYGTTWPGVKQAVDFFFRGNHEMIKDTTIWQIRF